MKQLLTVLCAITLSALTGCGIEVATTAATSAAIKKQEIEAGKQTKAMAEKNIEQATQAMQQRNEQNSNADK